MTDRPIVDVYAIGPNLLGIRRWQAEVNDQPVRFCRRGWTRRMARRRLVFDLVAAKSGRQTFAQRWWLPAVTPIRRRHDRLARRIWGAR